MMSVMILSTFSLTKLLLNVEHVLIFLALLSVLILFHEFGHFLMAKRCGVTVTDFALGFGPSLLAARRGETTYRINALPLGGYCKMVGEDSADDGTLGPGNFQRKSIAARAGIIVAGPIFNLILAVLVFMALGLTAGVPNNVTNVVESVQPGSPAEAAGLRAGDRIRALDGKAMRSGTELVEYIHGHAGKFVAVDVMHDGTVRHLRIIARPHMVGGHVEGQFGFVPTVGYARLPFVAAVQYGFVGVAETIGLQFAGVTGAIRAHDASVISGPVGIARVVIGVESYGWQRTIGLAASISVILGVFNLLPFPALDGGRLAFLLVEAVRGRPVDAEKEGLVHLTGFALLMVLVIFVTYHDIVQWVHGQGGL
ncbi:MAG: site-2 protease family protein [Candidatus Eremiobacteraeota bacterium]|nr:site-2 protease family protein [Candidatus Eremiobacteraeota bacterium]